MFAKCRYMDEITGSRGVVFATGTPVSNSMTELYTMQRYLQYDRLQELGMTHFDCWASRFGETVTALELAPEGTGYRARILVRAVGQRAGPGRNRLPGKNPLLQVL